MQSRIRQLRTERGYSQQQLAEAIKSSQQSITDWETGKKIPRTDALVAIANLFDVSIDYIVGATDCPYRVKSYTVSDGEVICFTTEKSPQPEQAEGESCETTFTLPKDALPKNRQEFERFVESLVRKALSERQ